MNKNYVVIEARLETKSFDKQIEYVEKRAEEIQDLLKRADLGEEVGDVLKLEAEYEKLMNTLSTLKEKRKKAFESTELAKEIKNVSKEVSNISKNVANTGEEVKKMDFSKIGDSINDIVKKVGKWTLAVFGIRSAYMFIRNAINTISQDNEQLATDIDFMKRALAYTIEPVVQTIVNLAKTLMQYVAYIVKAWTGRDIFARANKNLKNANKQAKELKKTTAGFDKLNILSNNKSTGGGGGGATPSITPLEEGQVPEWLKWIGENKDTVIGFLTEFAIGIIAIKVASADFMALGIGIILVGIFETIKSIVKFIKDPSWENFANILTGLSIILAGVAVAMLAVNSSNPLGWIALAISAITALVAVIIKNWDSIKETFKKGIDWIKNLFNGLLTFISNLWTKIKSKLSSFGTKAGEVIGSAFKTVFNGIMKVIENFLNTPIKAINKLIGVINKVPGINLGKLTEFKLPRLAKGTIASVPGKGIPTPSGIYAEAGREAYLPLSNESLLEELGYKVGKHVKINADITLELESRILARVMKEINANNGFARNGG